MPETNNYTPPTPPNDPPGKSNATASLVLGIIAVVLWFFGYSAIISVILGIVGLIQASKAKELGYEDTTRTAGFILSLIGLIGGALAFVACVACVGLFASTGIAAGGLSLCFLSGTISLCTPSWPCWGPGRPGFMFTTGSAGGERTPAGRSRRSSGVCWGQC